MEEDLTMDTLQNIYLFGTIVLLIMWVPLVLKGVIIPQSLAMAFISVVLWPVTIPFILFKR